MIVVAENGCQHCFGGVVAGGNENDYRRLILFNIAICGCKKRHEYLGLVDRERLSRLECGGIAIDECEIGAL